MKIFNKKPFIIFLTTVLLITAIGLPVSLFAVEPPVTLGSTISTFAVLAGTTITNTGSTIISGSLPEGGGNIGVNPGSEITHLADITMTEWTAYSAGTVALQAQAELIIAYDDAAGRTPFATINPQLGEITLVPGIYRSEDGFKIDGTLTLDAGGDPNAVFVFQSGSDLITATDSHVVLANGARYCRVFWKVTSSATLGVNSHFVGHIFALTSIWALTGAEVQGQLLARTGEVTLDTNTIINGICSVQTGSLTVRKTLFAPADFNMNNLFTFTVIDSEGVVAATVMLRGGESITIPGLKVGEYTITESATDVADYNWNVAVSGDANTNGTLTILAGLTQAVTFTNTYVKKTGSLTIRKTLFAPADFNMNNLFTFTVTNSAGIDVATVMLKGGESTTIPGLEVGTYTITESATDVADYNWNVAVSGDASTNGTLTVAEGSQTVTFTNTYIQSPVQIGNLTVTKTLYAPAGFDMNKQFTFIVRDFAGNDAATVWLKGGESTTISGLEVGTYTITEYDASVANYNWNVTVSGAASTNVGSLTIAAGSQTVDFTNIYVKQITAEETTAAQTTAAETTAAQTTAAETTAAETTAAQTTAAETTPVTETTPAAEITAAQTTKSVTTDIKTAAEITEVITENAETYKAGDTTVITSPQTSKNISGFVIGIVLLAGISSIIIYKSKKNK